MFHLHEKHHQVGRFVPHQLAAWVDKQVEGQQAELDEEHQGVVPGLERLRPRRTVVPRWIQGCAALAHTLHRSINPDTSPPQDLNEQLKQRHLLGCRWFASGVAFGIRLVYLSNWSQGCDTQCRFWMVFQEIPDVNMSQQLICFFKRHTWERPTWTLRAEQEKLQTEVEHQENTKNYNKTKQKKHWLASWRIL